MFTIFRGYDDVEPAIQTYLHDRMDQLMKEVEEREGEEGETTRTRTGAKSHSTTRTRKRKTHS